MPWRHPLQIRATQCYWAPMRAVAFISPLFVLMACTHTDPYPTIPIPRAHPVPEFHIAAPRSVSWTGDANETFNIVLRGLHKQGFTILYSDRQAGAIRSELVEINPYFSNRLQRRLIEQWNGGDAWFRHGMASAGGVRQVVYRRLTVLATVEPSNLVISLTGESRTGVHGDKWIETRKVTDDEMSRVSRIFHEIQGQGEQPDGRGAQFADEAQKTAPSVASPPPAPRPRRYPVVPKS